METNKLTIIEIRYIRSLAAVKTDEELAAMIEKPVELIKAQFALMAGLPRRPGEKIILEKLPPAPIEVPDAERALQKSSKKSKIKKLGSKTKAGSQRDKQVKKAAKKRVQVQVNEKVLHRQKEWKGKNDKVQYQTKSPVSAGMILFRLNHKTTIYAKPGTNIEELKRKYKIL